LFTGIITNESKILSAERSEDGLKLTFETPKDWQDLALGESISTNGVCLTVAAIGNDSYSCVLIPETLKRSTFGKYQPTRVNLERALRLSDRIDGHLVQGHVDEVGIIERVSRSNEGGLRFSISFSSEHQDYIIEKGSISVDGVALTVTQVNGSTFEVALIPYTLRHTTLGDLKESDMVNLEFDIIGKYVTNNLKNWRKNAAS
jgi:riboflavin synthase